MGVDELQQLAQLVAPNLPGAAVFIGAMVYVARIVRAELREQRASRAQTSTVGVRLGGVERRLTRLQDALAAQGLYVPEIPTARVEDVEDLADDYPETELHRTPVPPLPPVPPRHAARSMQ